MQFVPASGTGRSDTDGRLMLTSCGLCDCDTADVQQIADADGGGVT